MCIRDRTAKKIVLGVAIFSVGIIIADLVIVWDTTPKKTVAAKYTFNKQDLGCLLYTSR